MTKYYIASSDLPLAPFDAVDLLGLSNCAEESRLPGLRIFPEYSLAPEKKNDFVQVMLNVPLDSRRVSPLNKQLNEAQKKSLPLLTENRPEVHPINSIGHLVYNLRSIVGKHRICEILGALHVDAINVGDSAEEALFVTNPGIIQSIGSPFFDPKGNIVSRPNRKSETFLPKTAAELKEQFTVSAENKCGKGSKCVYAFEGERGAGYLKQAANSQATREEFLSLRVLRAMGCNTPEAKLILWRHGWFKRPTLAVSALAGQPWENVRCDLNSLAKFRIDREIERLRTVTDLADYDDFHDENVFVHERCAGLIDPGGAFRRDMYGKAKQYEPIVRGLAFSNVIYISMPETRYLTVEERARQFEELVQRIPDIETALKDAVAEIQRNFAHRNYRMSLVEREILGPLVKAIKSQANETRGMRETYAEAREQHKPRPPIIQVPASWEGLSTLSKR